jgi:hypothetical protein
MKVNCVVVRAEGSRLAVPVYVVAVSDAVHFSSRGSNST